MSQALEKKCTSLTLEQEKFVRLVQLQSRDNHSNLVFNMDKTWLVADMGNTSNVVAMIFGCGTGDRVNFVINVNNGNIRAVTVDKPLQEDELVISQIVITKLRDLYGERLEFILYPNYELIKMSEWLSGKPLQIPHDGMTTVLNSFNGDLASNIRRQLESIVSHAMS